MAMKMIEKAGTEPKPELVIVKRAIVSPPPFSYLMGVTDNPELKKAQKDPHYRYQKWREILGQWEKYHQALKAHVDPVHLKRPNTANPDSHYVQDHAFILNGHAIMAKPGSEERAKETAEVKQALIELAGINPAMIFQPSKGKLEIGDVVPDFEHKVIFIGITDLPHGKQRTDMQGVIEFALFMKTIDPDFTVVGLKSNGSPHLGSGFTVLGNEVAVFDPNAGIKFNDPLVPFPSKSFVMPFNNLTPNSNGNTSKGLIALDPKEGYAANLLVANGHAIYPAGYEKAEKIYLAHFGPENTTAVELGGSKEMNGSATCWHLPFFEIQRT